MALIDDIAKLGDLHAQGTLTDDEFAAAKAKLLSDSPHNTVAQPAAVTARLDDLARQNALIVVDRDWEKLRQTYMMRGRYGTSYVPTTSNAMALGTAGCIIGALMLCFAVGTSSAAMGLLGVATLVLSIVGAMSENSRAQGYQIAERHFRERRSRILNDGSGRDGDVQGDIFSLPRIR